MEAVVPYVSLRLYLLVSVPRLKLERAEDVLAVNSEGELPKMDAI
jgi:hypothetical protein